MTFHKRQKGFTPQHFLPKVGSTPSSSGDHQTYCTQEKGGQESARGFIALTSALIISSVMLLIATGGSLAGFYTRMNALNDEYKERSSALAESCVSHTLVTLAGTPTYTGAATTTVSGIQNGQCYTGAVSKSGVAPNDTYQFKTRAIYGNAYTSISIVAKTSDLSITSYTEVPMF